MRALDFGGFDLRAFDLRAFGHFSPVSLVATPSSVTIPLGSGPVTVQISDSTGAPLSSQRSLAARASVSRPGYAQPSAYFVGGKLVLTPIAVGSGVITIVYGDQIDQEVVLELPFEVTAT